MSTQNQPCQNDDGEDLREEVIGSMAGHHIAQQLVGLQEHKRTCEQAHMWAERANRIGWENAGVDVARIDREMRADDEVDSSIKIGDTHVYMGPTPTPSTPAPTPTPTPPDRPPSAPTPSPPTTRAPWWSAWLLAGATSVAAGGLGAGLGYMMRDTPRVTPGGSAFDFDTRPPEWMTDDQ